MRAKGRRGNVLITALFMAIFLFFLSVAMVSTNRMDISLGLSVDHRLKADAAARAGLNWALRTMRTESDWAKKLKQGAPVLESGARIEVEVRARSNKSGSPFLLVVTSVGTSGLVSVRHWAVVEEVKKTEGLSPATQIFSRCLYEQDGKIFDNGLAMLAQDFQWYFLSQLPTENEEPNTLEASGGPLFAFAPEGTAVSPPSFIIALPMFLEGGGQALGPQVRLEIVPPGRHLVVLRLDPKTKEMTWEDIPDPGTQEDLGRVSGLPEINDEWEKSLPVVRMWEDPRKAEEKDQEPWESRSIHMTGKGDHANGFEIFTVDSEKGIWDPETGTYRKINDSVPWSEVAYVESKTTTELTLEWKELDDSLAVFLDWYSLTGEALSARGNKIACQGLHTFYGQLPIAGERNFVDFGTPVYESIVYQAPCVLEYDLDTKKWTKLVDLMEIDKPNTQPSITRSKAWRSNFLEGDSKGQPYITTKKRRTLETPETDLVRYTSINRDSSLGTIPGENPRAVIYQDRAYYFNQSGYLPGTNTPRRFLTGFHGAQLDPNAQLGGDVPAITAFVPEGDEDKEYQFKPAEEIAVGLAGERFDIITHGKDLLALGLVRRQVDDDDKDFPRLGDFNQSGEYALTTKKTMVALLRYNGEAWQIWPGGGADLLKSFGTSTDPGSVTVPGFKGMTNTPLDITLRMNDGLAFSSYEFDYPVLNRYAVIAAGKNDPPPLKGFEAE